MLSADAMETMDNFILTPYDQQFCMAQKHVVQQNKMRNNHNVLRTESEEEFLTPLENAVFLESE